MQNLMYEMTNALLIFISLTKTPWIPISTNHLIYCPLKSRETSDLLSSDYEKVIIHRDFNVAVNEFLLGK